MLVASVALVLSGDVVTATASIVPPDVCKLITVAELQSIVGVLSGAPRAGDAANGDVSCEWTPAKGVRWLSISLHDGELTTWRKRNGGTQSVLLPEFGKDAFLNPDADGSVDLFVKKGVYVMRVGLPTGGTAVETAKAVARKALVRL
ncbi:MAG: hypothetical protein IT354_09880 [Gemmatimonadaceae bacterium]|nr:hypothetical protein [Gemmatimonadaceae bacterium]